MQKVARLLHEDESGHWQSLLAATIAGAGAVALGIGAATDSGWLAIAGGVVAGVALVGYEATRHVVLDREFFRRTDDLTKPQ